MKTAAVIVAAGKGKRFGGKVPKQFLKVNGKTLLAYAIENFETSGSIDYVLLVVSEEFIGLTRRLVKKHKFKKVIGIITGGSERYLSVYNALEFLKNIAPDKVLIHDGARPLPIAHLIKDITTRLDKNDAVVPVNKIFGTIKRVGNGEIKATLNRTELRTSHTPQGFKYKTILALYTKANLKKYKPTDEAALFEVCGKKVTVIEDDTPNIKITTGKDLKVLKVLLKN